MPRFDLFVLIAEMRTGSNFLEENLAGFPGVETYGEAFNPGFLGQPGRREMLGVTLPARRANPGGLIERMRARPALAGFRFFHDHDVRVIEALLPDPRCAKILLCRNPLDALVSRRIAEATGQWCLTDRKDRRSARVRFDPADLEESIAAHCAFRARIRRAMAALGQELYTIGYDEIGDLAALNRLGRWLGLEARLGRVPSRLKRQNPAPLVRKVSNQSVLRREIARMGLSGLMEEVAPGLPDLVGDVDWPLLVLPLPGGPTREAADWLGAICDGKARRLDRKDLRQWRARRPRGRIVTLVEPPLDRAAAAFQAAGGATAGATPDTLRRAFLRFLVRADATGFRSQSACLREVMTQVMPDAILRAGEPGPALAAWFGPTPIPRRAPGFPAQVMTGAVARAIERLWPDDHAAFGDWEM